MNGSEFEAKPLWNEQCEVYLSWMLDADPKRADLDPIERLAPKFLYEGAEKGLWWLRDALIAGNSEFQYVDYGRQSILQPTYKKATEDERELEKEMRWEVARCMEADWLRSVALEIKSSHDPVYRDSKENYRRPALGNGPERIWDHLFSSAPISHVERGGRVGQNVYYEEGEFPPCTAQAWQSLVGKVSTGQYDPPSENSAVNSFAADIARLLGKRCGRFSEILWFSQNVEQTKVILDVHGQVLKAAGLPDARQSIYVATSEIFEKSDWNGEIDEKKESISSRLDLVLWLDGKSVTEITNRLRSETDCPLTESQVFIRILKSVQDPQLDWIRAKRNPLAEDGKERDGWILEYLRNFLKQGRTSIPWTVEALANLALRCIVLESGPPDQDQWSLIADQLRQDVDGCQEVTDDGVQVRWRRLIVRQPGLALLVGWEQWIWKLPDIENWLRSTWDSVEESLPTKLSGVREDVLGLGIRGCALVLLGHLKPMRDGKPTGKPLSWVATADLLESEAIVHNMDEERFVAVRDLLLGIPVGNDGNSLDGLLAAW